MRIDWENKLLAVESRENETQFLEFVELVDEARNYCTIDIARLLMSTFHNEPDFGSQEAVVRVLASADADVRIMALLEELPRLANEAWEWGLDFVLNETRFQNTKFLCALSNSGNITLKAMEDLLQEMKKSEDDLKMEISEIERVLIRALRGLS